MYQQIFMDRVIALSRQAIDKPGTQPFGALLVRNGEIVGEGLNHAIKHHDPTSHGEIEAIRDACQRLQTNDLSDCDMYAIGEPCPMCTAAIKLSRIRHLYYGATHSDATAAFKPLANTEYADIGVTALRHDVCLSIEQRSTGSSQHQRSTCSEVYVDWVAATVDRCNRA